MADFSSASAKLDRADEHLATIQASLDAWRNSDAYTVIPRENAHKTHVSFHLSIVREPPLTRWGLVIGDCVHNLRGALDHVAWECSVPNGDPPSGTEFPVMRDRDSYFGTGGYGGRSGVKKIAGVIDAAYLALFEKFQPWQNPGGVEIDSLWLIHEFDREDKHRLLTPILVVPRELASQFVIEYRSPEDAKAAGAPLFTFNPGPIKDGAELFSISLIKSPLKMQMKGSYSLATALEYGGGRRGGMTTMLGAFCQHVRRIVEEFRDASL